MRPHASEASVGALAVVQGAGKELEALARALADLMLRGGVPARAQVKRVTGQLGAELRRLCAIIDVEARACAVEASR
jgi:hypothetical protein